MKSHQLNLVLGFIGVSLALVGTLSTISSPDPISNSGLKQDPVINSEPVPPASITGGPTRVAADAIPMLDLDLSKLPAGSAPSAFRSSQPAAGVIGGVRQQAQHNGVPGSGIIPDLQSAIQAPIPSASSAQQRTQRRTSGFRPTIDPLVTRSRQGGFETNGLRGSSPRSIAAPTDLPMFSIDASPTIPQGLPTTQAASLNTPNLGAMNSSTNPSQIAPSIAPSIGLNQANSFLPPTNYRNPPALVTAPTMQSLALQNGPQVNEAVAAQLLGGHGVACPCGCQPRCTTQTIYVPCWETRYVNSMQTQYRQELRQKRSRQDYTVYDDVPQVETYTVQIPQPRQRTYTINVRQEFQEPVQENYTVMVQKPQQREVTVDREEAYEVPVITPYTEMVPERTEKNVTTFKTVIEKEPKQVKYVVQVPKERSRTVVKYGKLPVKRTVRKPVVRMETQKRSRPKIKYRTETKSRTISEEYVEYAEQTVNKPITRYVTRTRPKSFQKIDVGYEAAEGEYTIFEYSQKPIFYDKEVPFSITVPYTETKMETYYVNEPYPETITKTYPDRIQVPTTVTKSYRYPVPVTQYVPERYTVNVPYEIMRTAYRTVTRQQPVTRYRTITRDMGQWERKQVTCPTCQVYSDGCGCTTCAAGSQTCVRNVWCPKIVTQRIPYTDFKDVQQRLPYQVPQVLERQEVRTRLIPKTRYEFETKTAQLKSYEFQQSTRTQTFPVTKYRWVAKTRPITIKKTREINDKKVIPFVRYEEVAQPKVITYQYRKPVKEPPVTVQELETYQQAVQETISLKQMVPVTRTRTRTEQYTVRVPYTTQEDYEVTIPVTEYKELEETEYVEVPRVEVEKYTEMVPEFRTREEMVEVKRTVPVFSTKFETRMVPRIRTRTTSRTETRTVSEKVMKDYLINAPEVRTRTVQKTRYRDVPQLRTEVYWENVPETRYRTRMVRVPRQVARETVKTYSVNIPYQVSVRVPVQVCRMVPKTITIPVEDCCSNCGGSFDQLHEASDAYIQYGVQCLDEYRRKWRFGR